MRLFKLLFASVLVVAAFTAAAGTASAATITPSTTAIRGVSAGTLTFTGGGLTITCPFTLNGTLGSSITSPSPVTNAVIGAVTGGTPGTPCTGANGLRFLNFSWTIEITIILSATGVEVWTKFRNAQFLLDVPIAGSCLYAGDVVARRTFPAGTTRATLPQLDFAAQTVPKSSGGILCPSSGGLNGSVDLQPDLIIIIIL